MSNHKGLTEQEMLYALFEIPVDSDDEFDELNEFVTVEDMDGYLNSNEVELPVIDENLVFVESLNHNNPIVTSVPHDVTNDVLLPSTYSNNFSENTTQPTVSISENTNCHQKPFTPVTSVNWTNIPFEHNTSSQFLGSEELTTDILNLDSPYQIFSYFFDNDLIDHICEETLKYSIQKNIQKPFKINRTDFKRFLGISIMMSVHKNPSIRSYWSSNIGNTVIKNTMPVNVFEKIKQFLHFNDNSQLIPFNRPGHDRLYRIRPLLETLNKKFQSVPLEECLSIDEQLCSTKTKHYLKQYIPMKPHKWGYKLFVMAGVSGFAYNVEIYSGQENNSDLRLPCEPDIGASANVVVRLARIIPSNNNFKLYYDNYYTSIQLMIYLKSRGIESLGTVRRNRLKNVPFPSDTVMKSKDRGTMYECTATVNEEKITAVLWKDNKLVILLSTFVGMNPVEHVKRFSKKEKKTIMVPFPKIVSIYNKHMGGVDLLDANIGRYKISIKSRKWYMRLFYHLIDITVTNSWILQKRIYESKGQKYQSSLADFREELAVSLCQMGELVSPKRGRPLKEDKLGNITDKKRQRNVNTTPIDVRFDGFQHMPEWSQSRQKCKYLGCKGITYISCAKCSKALCFTRSSNCFNKYHMK